MVELLTQIDNAITRKCARKALVGRQLSLDGLHVEAQYNLISIFLLGKR
jgi:hypothetical protein